MPYILIHPLPPPRHNPYYPSLPTFTTSSRAIAHFFYSHGWRARHVYISSPPSPDGSSATASPTGSPSSSHSLSLSTTSLGYIDAFTLSLSRASLPDDEALCCRASTGSSILSCGAIIELHCYAIPINKSIFHGPSATKLQIKHFLWYAHPHISFEVSGGVVDLHLPNQEAMALQKEADEEFWRTERKTLRIKNRKAREAREKANEAVKDIREALKAFKEKRGGRGSGR
ncbi:hypothetical protein BU25DRAFT_488625 [Macroventuria anomochaeta]|uniref:Uncharacterized protein n=1 Tax=Macroventuria anomochaeta TaxID=301207 RepID=A0ACB6SDM6_9PLEO|nr:uncharacterized protein BU25DRAFT_488625 [Macroventuria anomochaeta]KAF2631207.1 hypothetical protein BU25DRAFT_488625 [Macroventuria anomochaeta]